MTTRDRWLDRLRRVLSYHRGEADRVKRETEEEIDAHLAARIEHLVSRGLTAEAARAEALRRFGDLESGRTALVTDAARWHRRRRLRQFVGANRGDVQYAVRSLRRSPAFSLGVIFTFALGLGINTSVFRVADTVLFKPPAGVRDARAVRQLETLVTFDGGEPTRATAFSWTDAQRFAASKAFTAFSAGTLPRQAALSDGRPVSIAYVDHDYFRLLGVGPIEGRAFHAEEGRPGGQVPVAIVSRGFWQRELGERPLPEDLVVSISARAYRVVGVTPGGFTGIDLDPVDVWLPLGVAELGRGMANGVAFAWYESEMARPLRLIGRLPPGLEDAPVGSRLTAAIADRSGDGLRPTREVLLRPIVPVGRAAASEAANRVILRLAAVAGVVLLIAAANAANLLLARGLRRQPELAVRAAMGASRARLCRLLAVESTVLAICGGAAALVAANWTAEILRRLLFPDGRWTAAGFDLRVAIFTASLALGAGLAAGLAPMLQSTGFNVAGVLKDGRAQGGRRRRTRMALLVAQTALTLVLLVASGLLILSLVRLNQVRIGFEPSGLVTASLSSLGLQRMGPGADRSAIDTLIQSVSGGDSVSGISLASLAPFGATARSSFSVPGSSFTPDPQDEPVVSHIAANYFTVIGTRVLEGRPFTDADAQGEPVSIVSESMARAYWGRTLPPGACILTYGRPCARVVGVVEDVRESPASGAPIMRYYLPLSPSAAPSVVVARTAAANAPALVSRIRANVPADYRATIEVTVDRVNRALRPWRTAAWLFVALGAVALVLACGGIYSVMTYVAADRTREIGVRIALGATRGDVLGLIVRDGLRLVVIAGIFGLAAAAAGGHLLGSLLFGVSPFEPAIYLAGFAAVATAALLAMLVPARRASRLDAIVALRQGV